MTFNKAIHLGASWTPTIGATALVADKAAIFSSAPYTHSSITFAAGLVVVGISQQNNATNQIVSSVTIKGVSATKIANVDAAAGDSVSLWAAEVTAGSGSIVFNNGGVGFFNLDYNASTLTGYTSATPVSTPTWDGMTSQQSDPQGPISSLTVPAGGFAIIVLGNPYAPTGGLPITWVGATRVAALEVDDSAAGNGDLIAGAYLSTPGTYTNITASGATSRDYSALVAAVFH